MCEAPVRDVLCMNIPIKFYHKLATRNAIIIMASTNVCQLDCRSSVNLFTAIGSICNFNVENIFIYSIKYKIICL